MSLNAGLNRADIQDEVGLFIEQHSGVPVGNVIYNDFAGNEPAPKQAWVAYLMKPDTREVGPAKWREAPSLEYWRVEIVSVTVGFTYTISILGVDYSYIALVADTVTDIRDALFALIPAVGVDYTATSVGTATSAIDIESDVTPGLRLLVTVNQAVSLMLKTQFRGDSVTVSHETAEIEMDIMCVGNYVPEDPTAEDSGEAIASRLQARFRNQALTAAMRAKHIVPRRSRRAFGNQILDREAFSMGRLVVTFGVDQAAVADSTRSLEASATGALEGC